MVPRRRNSTPEFGGETRARVVLIGGGGAVTGTVSSLFSWVWYASRDWPPSHSVPLSVLVHLLFATTRRRIVRFCLASRARETRDEESSPCLFPDELAEICRPRLSITPHTHVRSTFAGKLKRMPRTRIRVCSLANSFSLSRTQDESRRASERASGRTGVRAAGLSYDEGWVTIDCVNFSNCVTIAPTIARDFC